MENNILKYRAFVESVDTGSFTLAGDKLGYTQSAISRMIKDLEEDTGLVLLERSKSGVTLTSEGAEMLPLARNIIKDCEHFYSHSEELKEVDTGFIRIATFSSVATHWLPNIFREFQKDYPGIDYELLMGDYGEIEEWVENGRVDCGFVLLPVKKEIETYFLEKDPYKAVVSRKHPHALDNVFPVSAFNDGPFLLLRKGNHNDIEDILRENGIQPDIHFTTWDDYAIMSMVESNLGAAVLPGLILKREPYDISIMPLDIPAYREIGFAVKDANNTTRAVKKFTEYLKYRNGPIND